MDKLLVIVFSYAWFGVEVYNQIQQRKRRDRTVAPVGLLQRITSITCGRVSLRAQRPVGRASTHVLFRCRSARLRRATRQRSIRRLARRSAPTTLTFSTALRFYAADPDMAACHRDASPAGPVAITDGLKPLAISQTAMTISCTASGAMRTPSESPNMLPSGGTM